MERKDLFTKVGLIVRELSEQYQFLSDNPENLNDLELELFLANANFLTDHIEILRKINNAGRPVAAVEESAPKQEYTASSQEPEPIQEPGSDSTLIPEQTQNASSEDDFVHAADEIQQPAENAPAESLETSSEQKPGDVTEIPEIRDSRVEEASTSQETAETEPDQPQQTITDGNEDADVISPVAASAATPEEVVKEVVIPEKTVSVDTPVTLGDAPIVPTINDMISARTTQATVGTRFTSRPVADLKSIISLNDKLLFVKELFNGYSLAYSEAIELLNRFDSFEAADNFLKANYAEKNNWSDKQSSVDKLYDALNRRFAR